MENKDLITSNLNQDIQDNVDKTDKISPMGFLELLYGILFQPTGTLARIAREVPLLYSFTIFLGVNLINLLITFLTARGEFNSFARGLDLPPDGLGPVITVVGTVVLLLFALVRWYIGTGILHLTAEFFGGQGRALSLLAVLGCAALPAIFTAPVEVLLYALNAPAFLGTLMGLPLGIWGLYLMIIGLRETYRFSSSRAIAVFVIPFVAVLFIGIILVLAVVSLLVPLLSTFPELKGI